MTESTQTVRGIRVHMRRSGKGEPLLFLHGITGAFQSEPFFDQLAGRFELIAPDHPGFGQSDDPEWIRSVRDVAMFYLDLLDDLDLSRVHVVGHSIGGWVAAEMAARNCTRLSSLTLIAPAGLRLKGVPVGDPFMASPDDAFVNLYADRRMGTTHLESYRGDAEIMLRNRFSFARLAWQPRLFDPDLGKWLHRVKVPACVMWGEDDRLIPPAYAALWKEHVPQAVMKNIKGCGHLPPVEQPSATAGAVLEFLAGVPQ
jgi:pimeloyl-ACP methyl ester carboxylesterase